MNRGSEQPTKPQKPQKHVTTACLLCRKGKEKCDGNLPCLPCSKKSRNCQYDTQQDARKINKRGYEELSTRSEMLDTIIYSLKTNDNRSNEDLITIIRGGATMGIIAQHASDNTRRAKEFRRHLRDNTLSVNTLVDQPVVRVPAQPWTDVIEHDDTVSHLLSAYLTWQHSTYPSFDPGILVQEMNSKQIESRYCSKFLVNALLALGCMYTDHPAAFAESGDMSSRGVHFLSEATRLWQSDEGNVSLTNLQGLTTLIVCVVYMGKDRLALLYCAQLNALRQALEKKSRQARKLGEDQQIDSDFQRSCSYAVWAAFKLEVELSMAWRTPYNLFIPSLARPLPGKGLEMRDEWRPYPRARPVMNYNSSMIDNAGYNLYEIGVDICAVLLSGSPQDSPLPGHAIMESSEKVAKAHEIGSALLTWHDGLPSLPIAAEKTTAPYITGPNVDVQLTYYIWRITISKVVIDEAAASQPERDAATEQVLSACRRIATLLQYSQTAFGLLNYPTATMHAASMGAHSLIRWLSQSGIPDLFHTMVVTLAAGCCRWTIVRGIMRTLWITIKELKLERFVHGATISLMKLNAVEKWGKEDHRLFINCTYPNYATSSTSARDLVEVGDLLASYAAMDLNKA